MKLKQVLASLAIFGLLTPMGVTLAATNNGTAPTSLVYQAISKYKNRNYTGCIQDLDYAISHGRSSDIAFYYKALSYARLGMKEDARSAYESAYNMTSNYKLAEYAKQAVSCIDDPETCDSKLDPQDITFFIKSNKFMHPDVEEAIKNQAMERAKTNINSEAKPNENDLKYLQDDKNNEVKPNEDKQWEDKQWEDKPNEGEHRHINYNYGVPTDKEIADAVRTFQKMGLNPFSNGMNMNTAYGQNAEMMQLSALLNNQNNNNNNNNMMNLVPMLTALQSQGGSNSTVSKDFMQAYMLNQMLPNFNFGSNNDK